MEIKVEFENEQAEQKFKDEVSNAWVHVFVSDDGYLSVDVVSDSAVIASGSF